MTNQVFHDLRELLKRHSDGKVLIDRDTRIDEVLGPILDDTDFVCVAVALEAMLGVYIPDELLEDRNQTFFSLAGKVERLPHIQDRFYPADRVLLLGEVFQKALQEITEAEGEEWKQGSEPR